MHEDDTAYVCRECGEAFAPQDGDWPVLRKVHKGECQGATFERTTVGKAF
jgi:hypothetical protein